MLLFPNDLAANSVIYQSLFRLPLEEAKKGLLDQFLSRVKSPLSSCLCFLQISFNASVHHASALLLLLLLPVVVPGVDYSTPPRNTSSLLFLFLKSGCASFVSSSMAPVVLALDKVDGMGRRKRKVGSRRRTHRRDGQNPARAGAPRRCFCFSFARHAQKRKERGGAKPEKTRATVAFKLSSC